MLIGPEWVFTAASCLQHFNFSAISVRFQVGEGLEVRQAQNAQVCSGFPLEYLHIRLFGDLLMSLQEYLTTGYVDDQRTCSLSLSLSLPLSFLVLQVAVPAVP